MVMACSNNSLLLFYSPSSISISRRQQHTVVLKVKSGGGVSGLFSDLKQQRKGFGCSTHLLQRNSWIRRRCNKGRGSEGEGEGIEKDGIVQEEEEVDCKNSDNEKVRVLGIIKSLWLYMVVTFSETEESLYKYMDAISFIISRLKSTYKVKSAFYNLVERNHFYEAVYNFSTSLAVKMHGPVKLLIKVVIIPLCLVRLPFVFLAALVNAFLFDIPRDIFCKVIPNLLMIWIENHSIGKPPEQPVSKFEPEGEVIDAEYTPVIDGVHIAIDDDEV